MPDKGKDSTPIPPPTQEIQPVNLTSSLSSMNEATSSLKKNRDYWLAEFRKAMVEAHGEEWVAKVEISKKSQESLFFPGMTPEEIEDFERKSAKRLREMDSPYLVPFLSREGIIYFHDWDYDFEYPIRAFGESLETIPKPFKHPGIEIAEVINDLTETYFKKDNIRTIFSHKLGIFLSENPDLEDHFKNFLRSIPAEKINRAEVSLPELLSYIIDFPRLQTVLGSAIVRAQIADQYMLDHRSVKKIGRRIENHQYGVSDPIDEEDKVAITLMRSLFSEDKPLVIEALGTPENGQVVGIVSKESTILNDLDIPLLIDSVVQDAKEKVFQSNGSHYLYKKLEHSQTCVPKYLSNFPFVEYFIISQVNKDFSDLLRGNTSRMSTSEVKKYEEGLSGLAESMIRNIISAPSTIIIRERTIQLINHLGQGIIISINRNGDQVSAELKGFIDTQSVTPTHQIEAERRNYTRKKLSEQGYLTDLFNKINSRND